MSIIIHDPFEACLTAGIFMNGDHDPLLADVVENLEASPEAPELEGTLPESLGLEVQKVPSRNPTGIESEERENQKNEVSTRYTKPSDSIPMPSESIPIHSDSVPLPSESILLPSEGNSESASAVAQVDPPALDLKPLPASLRYEFLDPNSTYPVIINANLSDIEVEKLLSIIRLHRKAIGYSIDYLKGIPPSLCMHRIFMEDNHKPTIEHQRRLNPNMKEVV